MPFPKTKRVIYKNNPLDSVTCQLRYPPILRIDSAPPSDFQELIRKDFPNYCEKLELHQSDVGIHSRFSTEFTKHLIKSSMHKNHEFSSLDGAWKINLTRTFLSISTKKYQKWENLLEMFKPSILALSSIYKPPFFSRLGLRYIDIFDRSRLGLAGSNWTELLKPYFIGLLSTEVGKDIKHCENVYEINLPDNISVVRINTTFVKNMKTKEDCYLVDSDFYCPGRTACDKMYDRLNYLHDEATNLIQWIITEKLHSAMKPELL